jgi:hypothetical protein
MQVGFNLAESCAVAVSSPFVGRYIAIDRFAASQLEKVAIICCDFNYMLTFSKIEDKYGVDLVSKSVGVVAYPIGYTLGLAGFARNKVVCTK